MSSHEACLIKKNITFFWGQQKSLLEQTIIYILMLNFSGLLQQYPLKSIHQSIYIRIQLSNNLILQYFWYWNHWQLNIKYVLQVFKEIKQGTQNVNKKEWGYDWLYRKNKSLYLAEAMGMERPEQMKEQFRGLNIMPIRDEEKRWIHINMMSPYKKNVLHSQWSPFFHFSRLYNVMWMWFPDFRI